MIAAPMRGDDPRANVPIKAELYAELPHVKLSQLATGTTVIEDALAARVDRPLNFAGWSDDLSE